MVEIAACFDLLAQLNTGTVQPHLGIDAAYAQFEEGVKGSISVGKLADMVVLSDNPARVSPDRIKEIKVLKTVFNGRIFEFV